MTNPQFPNDPNRTGPSDDEYSRQSRLEREAQIDPELAVAPARPGRIALYAIGIALVLGAVFYGLNNTTVNQASTTPPAQTAQTQPASPPAPAGMRDVTPRTPTSPPGVTTGSATTPPAGQNNGNR